MRRLPDAHRDATFRHVHIPLLFGVLRYIVPSLPFFVSPQHWFAGNGGLSRVVYFADVCRTHRPLRAPDLALASLVLDVDLVLDLDAALEALDRAAPLDREAREALEARDAREALDFDREALEALALDCEALSLVGILSGVFGLRF